MRRYVTTQAARRDLREIWNELAVDSVAAADRVIDRLERAMALVGESPTLGHWREDVADKRHRFFIVFSYVVVYHCASTPIEILRVIHGARDLQSLLGPDSPQELN